MKRGINHRTALSKKNLNGSAILGIEPPFVGHGQIYYLCLLQKFYLSEEFARGRSISNRCKAWSMCFPRYLLFAIFQILTLDFSKRVREWGICFFADAKTRSLADYYSKVEGGFD